MINVRVGHLGLLSGIRNSIIALLAVLYVSQVLMNGLEETHQHAALRPFLLLVAGRA
jgi:hypothetical protein